MNCVRGVYIRASPCHGQGPNNSSPWMLPGDKPPGLMRSYQVDPIRMISAHGIASDLPPMTKQENLASTVRFLIGLTGSPYSVLRSCTALTNIEPLSREGYSSRSFSDQRRAPQRIPSFPHADRDPYRPTTFAIDLQSIRR